MPKIEAKINDNPLSVFNAKLVEYTINPCSYENGYFLPPKSIIPVRLNGNIGMRKVTIILDVIGNTESSIALSISNLTAVLIKRASILLPDGYYYNCVYDKMSTPEEKAPWIKRVKCEFYGYRHGARETIEISDGMVVSIKGNCEVPVKYTIEPGTDTTVSVNGITVHGVTATTIIDGIAAKVTMDKLNKFGDTDMVEFPKMSVGHNKMYVTGDATVTLEYYPIYL